VAVVSIIKVRGKLPPGGNRKGKIELYSHGRYFTVTGAHLEDTPTTIEARQEELTALHREIFAKPKEPPRPAGPGPTLELSDRELLDKAHQANDGEKFSKLWAGKWQGDYPSESEATAALLNKLVFWFGPDPARIDRLFRQSGLMRDKWDRPQSGSTWGALEIQKAIDRTTETYNPHQAGTGKGKGKSKGKRQEAAAPTLDRGLRLTDWGGAERLVALHGDRNPLVRPLGKMAGLGGCTLDQRTPPGK
jgi:putative DNA primase/helicase